MEKFDHIGRDTLTHCKMCGHHHCLRCDICHRCGCEIFIINEKERAAEKKKIRKKGEKK